MKRSAVVLGIIFFFLAGSLQGVAAPEDAQPVKCPKKVNVVAAKVDTAVFEEYARFNARFEAETVELTAAVDGKVTKVNVTDGNIVSRDFLVLELDNALADQIKAQEEEVSKWKTILKRRRNWKERSPRAEAQAERKIKEAAEQIETLKAEAVQRAIVTPMAGRIEGLTLEEGAEVTAGSVVARLVNDNRLFANLRVKPGEAGLFVAGSELTLDKDMVVTVKEVKDGVVVLEMDNLDKHLQPGDSVAFKMLKQRLPEAVVLSKGQILSDDEGAFVYLVNGKYAVRSALTLGAEENGMVLVVDGLNAGDHIITAEILSRKEGTLKPALQCLEDGKRIRMMRKDSESGRFVKAEKVEAMAVAEEAAETPEVTEEPEVEQPQPEPQPEPEAEPEAEVPAVEEEEESGVEQVARDNFFSLGLGAGYAKLHDENFGEVYGGGLDVQFKLAYTFKGQYELFLEVSYYKKSGVIELIDMETELVMAPIYIGGRYIFNPDGKVRPYLGLAWIVFNNKETHDFDPDASFDTRHGFALLGGLYYSLSPQVDLYGSVRYSSGKATFEDFEQDADLGGLRLHAGVVYKFTR